MLRRIPLPPLVLCTGVLCTTVLFTTAVADEAAVPVYDEPRHRLMQDGEHHRVLDLEVMPGDTTRFHTHDQPIFYVYLQSAALRVQPLGGEWSPIPDPQVAAGEVMVDDGYVAKPVTHRVGNVGDRAFRLILVLNERDTAAAPGKDVIAKMPGAPGVDNRYFAQSRIELAPKERLGWDGLDQLIVYVLVTDTHVVIREHGGTRAASGMHEPGHFATISSGRDLTFENRSDRPATIIAVAVR